MIRLLVLADDLTGAIDTSVQFSKYGISTLVTIESSLEKIRDMNVEVVAVDMETRHTEKRVASDTVRRLVHEANRIGIRWIYIKVDSTLRGNIGSEFEAALHANGCNRLFFVPAFPAAKRTTHNAVQYVDNVPLHETIYANDPFTPVASGFIPDIIAEQTDIPIVAIKPNELSELPSISPEKSIVVVDAKSEEDLFQIASVLLMDANNTLMAGSAGLAMMFSKLMAFERQIGKREKPKKTLVVCGSLNQVSIEQVKNAERAGVYAHEISQMQKYAPDRHKSPEGQKELKKIVKVLEEEGALILKSVPPNDEAARDLDNRQVARNMGAMVVEVLRRSNVDYLVVFGGDTLYGILSQMEDVFVMLDKELEPGVVCSRIAFEKRNLRLISKAGGFGDTYALINILQYIRGQKEVEGVDGA